MEDFLRVTMCCPVLQGYGLTETCACSFIGAPNFPVRAVTLPSYKAAGATDPEKYNLNPEP